MMRTAFADTADFADRHGTSMRRAALAIGLERVLLAERLRGFM